MTPIDVLLSVAETDGRLGLAGTKLRLLLPVNCPPALSNAVHAQRPALLHLLQLNFLIVHSEVRSLTLFWAPDETTKESLVAAGAKVGNVYTNAELEVLVRRRVRIAELPAIHAAKECFNE
jgi:hypothetical protein